MACSCMAIRSIGHWISQSFKDEMQFGMEEWRQQAPARQIGGGKSVFSNPYKLYTPCPVFTAICRRNRGDEEIAQKELLTVVLSVSYKR